jgi:hypothetical protein
MKTWASLTLLGIAFVPALGCAVPPTPCLLADSNISGNPYLLVFYYRQGSQTGACTEDPALLDQHPHFLYQESYPSQDGGTRLVAWTPAEFAFDAGQPPDPTRVPSARGRLTSSTPDPSGLCIVEGTAPAQQEIGGILVTYDFRYVQVLGNPAAQGTELLADVVITRGSCSAEYDALGIWPRTPCESSADCNPYPDPDHGRPTGSGLLPSLPVECDTGPILGDGGSGGYCFFPDAGPAGFPFLSGD